MTDEMASDDEIPDLFPAGVDSVDQEATGSAPLSLIPAPRAVTSLRNEAPAEAPAPLPFDDASDDWGGPAATSLNVDVSGSRRDEEDVPWPRAVTPSLDELAVDPEQATRVAGFGPPPDSVLLAPLYALRVLMAKRRLREKERLARAGLEEAEGLRDDNLAALAEDKRALLKDNVRFSRLYEEVDRHEETTVARRAALQQTDAAGARALAEMEAQISGLAAQRAERERAFGEQQNVLGEAERSVSRARAALKKIDIQWRNVESRARALPGKEMPDELDRELDALEEQKKAATSTLQSLLEARQDIARLTVAKEDELRLATATVRRAEGEKEALLMTHQGEMAKHAKELDDALRARRDELAGAARAILHLRGEVPVSAKARRSLLRSDEAVFQAALELETVRRAQLTVDVDTFGRGRMLLIVLALAVLIGTILAIAM